MPQESNSKASGSGIVTFPMRPGRVLVVDDEENNRRFLHQLLTSKGYCVETAQDGERGLDLVEEFNPDVLILDVLMPGINGYEVCRRLKSNPETAYIHVLIFTSLEADEDRIEGIEAGANDFLTKNAHAQEILLRVRNAVMAKQLFDEAQEEFRELRKLDTLRACLQRLTAGNDAVAAALVSFGLQMMKWDSEGWTDEATAALAAAEEKIRELMMTLGSM